MLTSLNDLMLVVMTTLMTPSGMTSVPLTYNRSIQQRECDVTVWDSTRTYRRDRAVHTVTAGCDEGRVTWRYPQSGLRISFNTSTTSDDDTTPYDVCTIVSVMYCDVKLSLDSGDSLRMITVLKSSSSSSSWESVETCFQSSRGHAVSLYAESLPTATSHLVGRLVVDYDVERHVNRSRDMPACQPCSDAELLETACMSDFTIEGRMLSVVTSNNSNWTTINVPLVNVIHETTHFVDLLTSTPRDPAVQSRGVEGSRTRELIVPLRTPSVCQVRRGDGVFVFVGRIRLKRILHIQCAPRLDEFRRSWFSAVQHQRQPCHLDVT